ncbi:MAG TPA: 2-isopropylmalate synthase, partial [Leptospiraceae bacterium]|nr:2-isopropylmalate synthase [Leptospiraceae bacterium]
TYENGSKYVGEWRNGKKHGQGSYTQATATNGGEIKKPQKTLETRMTGEKKSTPFWSGTK